MFMSTKKYKNVVFLLSRLRTICMVVIKWRTYGTEKNWKIYKYLSNYYLVYQLFLYITFIGELWTTTKKDEM